MGEASLGMHVVDSVFGRNIGRGDSLGTNHSYIPVHIYSAYNSPSRGSYVACIGSKYHVSRGEPDRTVWTTRSCIVNTIKPLAIYTVYLGDPSTLKSLD